jgi:peptide/nickel transport system ATP-binding protein
MSLNLSLQQSSATVPVLELEDVTIRYRTAEGDRTVVEGVSFQINPGEVALVGSPVPARPPRHRRSLACSVKTVA